MSELVLAAARKIFVAGHNGLVGSAFVRALQARGCLNLLLRPRTELDLCDQQQVDRFFATERPEVVILAAAKVGGIGANSAAPADFIRDNLLIQSLVIDAAYRRGTKKLLFLGSSCIYPRDAAQPIPESALLSGPLEASNEWYAVAKIAGIKLCQAYRRQYGFDAIAAMPTNLYGPNDNYDPESSHMVAALIRKFADAVDSGASEVEIWGTGSPRREILHVDDCAEAGLYLLEHYSDEGLINVGAGADHTIRELAELIGQLAGFKGRLRFDARRPDGTPRKLMDSSRLMALGWSPRISLAQGIERTLLEYRAKRGVKTSASSLTN